MKSPNPFSPGFSAPPSVFVGRDEYLDRISDSLTDSLDPYRCFFIEGTRGSGKTVLLHQMAAMARDLGWLDCTANSIHASDELFAVLEDEFGAKTTFTATIKPTLSIPGVGDASLGELSAQRGIRQRSPLLTSTVIKALGKKSKRKGLFFGVDEAQRIGEQDAVEVCAAYQEARSRGLPMAIVITGLPGTHERIASFPHCTFTRRAPKMVLESFDVAQTLGALSSLFAKVPEIRLSEDRLFELAHFTQGHPYLIQLVGYHLYRLLDERAKGADGKDGSDAPLEPTGAEIVTAEDFAYDLYRENILKPTIDPLGPKTTAYLEALTQTMDADGVMTNGIAVAHAVGKQSAGGTSQFRRSLVDKCILEELGRGKLGFMIPYIPRYLRERGMERPRIVGREGKWKREL